jgi:hypothetical protein
LRVFCTLLILVLISLPPAIFSSRRAGLDPPLVASLFRTAGRNPPYVTRNPSP